MKIKVKLRVGNFDNKWEEFEIDAIETKCPELVITHVIVNAKDGKVEFDDDYNVTHVKSGFTVLRSIRYKKWALAAVEKLAEIEGWDTLDADDPAAVVKFAEDNRVKIATARGIGWGDHD
jgi:hypothetical protein